MNTPDRIQTMIDLDAARLDEDESRAKLKEAVRRAIEVGNPLREVARQAGISTNTVYAWTKS